MTWKTEEALNIINDIKVRELDDTFTKELPELASQLVEANNKIVSIVGPIDDELLVEHRMTTIVSVSSRRFLIDPLRSVLKKSVSKYSDDDDYEYNYLLVEVIEEGSKKDDIRVILSERYDSVARHICEDLRDDHIFYYNTLVHLYTVELLIPALNLIDEKYSEVPWVMIGELLDVALLKASSDAYDYVMENRPESRKSLEPKTPWEEPPHPGIHV